MSHREMNKIDAFEMWVYHRVLKIPRMRNTKYQLLQLIIEGKIEGKRGMGRKKMSWLRNIRQWTGLLTVKSLIHKARDGTHMSHISEYAQEESKTVTIVYPANLRSNKIRWAATLVDPHYTVKQVRKSESRHETREVLILEREEDIIL